MATTANNLKPLFTNVLIKPVEAEATTASGIVLPDTAQEKPQMGIIMAVGEGDTTAEGKKIEMKVKVGQKVVYKKWGGNEVKVGTEEWTIIDQRDILAIVE